MCFPGDGSLAFKQVSSSAYAICFVVFFFFFCFVLFEYGFQNLKMYGCLYETIPFHCPDLFYCLA